jgi:hypothetical protein
MPRTRRKPRIRGYIFKMLMVVSLMLMGTVGLWVDSDDDNDKE